MNSMNFSPFKNFRYDIPASIVVFLVAMPLCLGIALASGAPIFSGIIAGIVGGIVVTSFSGSPLGVSGPAAGLILIVIEAINVLGTFEAFLLAVLISGIIQLILGFAKAGVIAYYFPSSVIKGMLSGIGITIILKQIPHAFGYDKDPEGDLAFIQQDGHNTLSELRYMWESTNNGAIIISVVALLILILWEQPFMKKLGFTNIIQGALVVVLTGIGLNLAFVGTAYELGADQVVSIPVSESISGFFQQFTFPDFKQLGNWDVYLTAVTIAVVASIETLLCVEATDKLDPQKRVTPTNRELRAQGIGNMVSGLVGGLPITQVIVRSSANIQSGGKTKASAFIHGVLLLLSAMFIPKYLNFIPYSALAGILFVVGFKLAKPSIFKEMFNRGFTQFIPFLVTILGIIFIDLLKGIGLGMAFGIVQILYNNYKMPYHLLKGNDAPEGDDFVIKLSEDVSFLNKGSILNTLNGIEKDSRLVIDARQTKTIHPDVIEILDDFQLRAKAKNIELKFIGLTEDVKTDKADNLGKVHIQREVDND